MTPTVLGVLTVGRHDDPQAAWTRLRALAAAAGLDPVAAARLALAAVHLVGYPAGQAKVTVASVPDQAGPRVEAAVEGGGGRGADLPDRLVDSWWERIYATGRAEQVAVLAPAQHPVPWLPAVRMPGGSEPARPGTDLRALLAVTLVTVQEQATRVAEAKTEVGQLSAELDATSQGLLALHNELSQKGEELERARTAAVRAGDAKAAFVATMSHEIRSPLNTILGFSTLLQDTGLTEEQVEYAETLAAASRHLSGLVDGVLDLSKMEADLLELEEIPFNLVTCVEEAARLVAKKAEDKQLALATLFSPEAPENVFGDPTRVRQILVNLLSNAVKFTAEGHVCVEVSTEPGSTGPLCRLAFDVQDTGPGIPAEALDRIMQPFTQADSATTRNFGGTGLGLSITRQLAERMSGGLSVASPPGQGATFRATITLRRGEPPPADRPLDGVEVLVIHPRPVVVDSIGRHLRSWGAQVIPAASVAEAVRRAPSWRGASLAIVEVHETPPGGPGGPSGAQPPGDPLSTLLAFLGDRQPVLPVIAVTPLAGYQPAPGQPGVVTVSGMPIRRAPLRDAVLRELGRNAEGPIRQAAIGLSDSTADLA